MSENKCCFICRMGCENNDKTLNTEIHCPRCGYYHISSQTIDYLLTNEDYKKKLHVLSYSIRKEYDNQRENLPSDVPYFIVITESFIDKHISENEMKVREKSNSLLLILSKEARTYDTHISVRDKPYLISLSQLKTKSELDYLLKDMMYKKLLISTTDNEYQITMDGWGHIEELTTRPPNIKFGSI